MDPGYRRLKYLRYADDHILGFIGPKAEAEEIKAGLAAFLRETLGLELNQAKTLITHARTQRAPFLGYDISVWHCNTRITGGRRANDVEKIVENLVYQHMVRLGYEVKIGQLYSTEIDFVGTKGDDVVYVQAAYLITEEKTFNREFGNLMPIKDNYPKYVISMTPYMDSSNWKGIIHIPFVDFLKNGFEK
jgi:hypothetical protein